MPAAPAWSRLPQSTVARTVAAGAWAVLVAIAPLRGVGRPAAAAPRAYPPCTVLLLTPTDATVDSGRLGPLRQQIVRLRQQYEFIRRHFTVIGETMADQAASAEPPLVLGDPAGPSPGVLDAIARRTRADWVVHIVVREIKTDPSPLAEFQVHSSLLVQIWDARTHTWQANLAYTGRTRGAGAPGRLFIESLDDSVGEALAALLPLYPPVIAVSREGGIVNYLAGQSAPFAAAAALPFAGLGLAPTNRP